MSSYLLKRENRLKFLASYALHLTLNSYIKPGAVHRFSPSLDRFDNLMLFAHVYSSILENLIAFGSQVSAGKKSISEAPISGILQFIRSTLYAYSPGMEERLLMPLFFASAADVFQYVIKGDVGGEQLFIFSSWSGDSSREFFESLKAYDREARLLLSKEGYTESSASNASVLELINHLASVGRREYEFLLKPPPGECVSEIREKFASGETLNNSVISGYARIVLQDDRVGQSVKSELQAAMRAGGMKTREGSRALLELDRKLAAVGVDNSDLLVLLLKCVDKFMLGER